MACEQMIDFVMSIVFTKLASQLTAEKFTDLAIIPAIFVVMTAVSYVCSYIISRLFRFQKRQANFVTAMAVGFPPSRVREADEANKNRSLATPILYQSPSLFLYRRLCRAFTGIVFRTTTTTRSLHEGFSTSSSSNNLVN